MSAVSLQDVAEILCLHCVLCGETLDIEDFEAHAAAHHDAGECWTYKAFVGACALDPELTGWPMATLDGREAVWPFWVDVSQLQALAAAGTMEAIVA